MPRNSALVSSVTTWLTASEWAALDRLARQSGMSRAALARLAMAALLEAEWNDEGRQDRS